MMLVATCIVWYLTSSYSKYSQNWEISRLWSSSGVSRPPTTAWGQKQGEWEVVLARPRRMLQDSNHQLCLSFPLQLIRHSKTSEQEALLSSQIKTRQE